MRPTAPAGTPVPRHTDHSTAVRTAVLLAPPCALLVVLVAARWAPLVGLDADWARDVHTRALAEPTLTAAARVLTDWVWGPFTARTAAAAVAVWLVLRHAWRSAAWLVATVLCGAIVQQGLKAAVDRPRPEWRHPLDAAHGTAFPSGHTMTVTVVCGALLWLLSVRRSRDPLWWAAFGVGVVSAVGVGLTRVWLGVHWPSDVLGGWLLGSLTVAVAVALAPEAAGRS